MSRWRAAALCVSLASSCTYDDWRFRPAPADVTGDDGHVDASDVHELDAGRREDVATDRVLVADVDVLVAEDRVLVAEDRVLVAEDRVLVADGDVLVAEGDALVADADATAATAPRLVAPSSGSVVTTRRPTLRWSDAGGSAVQVCRDRACATVEQSFTSTTDRAVVPADLAPGVHFWRVARASGATPTSAWSATWEVFTPHASAARECVVGRALDLDGDGISDLAAGLGGSVDAAWVYAGASSGPRPPHELITDPGAMRGDETRFAEAVAAAGDLDGDGVTDLLVGARATDDGRGAAWVIYGGALPRRSERLVEPTRFFDGFGARVAGVGDVDGDGFSDVVVGAPGPGGGRARTIPVGDGVKADVGALGLEHEVIDYVKSFGPDPAAVSDFARRGLTQHPGHGRAGALGGAGALPHCALRRHGAVPRRRREAA